VQRCLTADPNQRLRDLGDLDLLLEHAPSNGPARRSWLAWGAAALLLATLGPVAVLHLRERPRASARVQVDALSDSGAAESRSLGEYWTDGGRALSAVSPSRRRSPYSVGPP